MSAVRTCKKCGETKPLDDYYNHTSAHPPLDGKRNVCKVCYRRHQTERKRAERDANPAPRSAAQLLIAAFGVEREAWMDAAACNGKPTSWWFPGQNESGGPLARRARQICEGCPVRAECLEYCDRTKTKDGMWGGELRNTRRRRQRREGGGEAA